MLIPKEVVPEWYDLGVALGLDVGTLNGIKANAARKPVEEGSREMLQRWLSGTTAADATPDRLIAALQRLKKTV